MDTSDETKLTLDSIPETTKKALFLVRDQIWLRDDGWYLAGGTALALQFGHRESYDLDFFTSKADIDPELISRRLSAIGTWDIASRDFGTLYGILNEVKCSFIAYPQCTFRFPFLSFGNLQIVDARDIAVMKILAVSQRCTKRDFFDLYWYANHRQDLEEVVNAITTVYPGKKHNMHHVLKSLIYFEDAEADPDPIIHFKARWEEVKSYFETVIPSLAKRILSLE